MNLFQKILYNIIDIIKVKHQKKKKVKNVLLIMMKKVKEIMKKKFKLMFNLI